MIVADIENPFFTSIVRGIEDGGREHGFRVMLCNSDEDLRKEADYIDVAISERMAGVVIAVASTRASKSRPAARRRDRRSSPSTAGRATRKIDCVLVDNERGAADATTDISSRSGSAGIACITGPQRVSTATERLAGYRKALRHAGVAARSVARRSDGLPRSRRVQGDARPLRVARATRRSARRQQPHDRRRARGAPRRGSHRAGRRARRRLRRCAVGEAAAAFALGRRAADLRDRAPIGRAAARRSRSSRHAHAKKCCCSPQLIVREST